MRDVKSFTSIPCRLFPIMLKFLPIILFFYAGWVYLLFFNFHDSFTATGFSNLIKEERSVRVISNELNDTLSL